MNRRRSVVLAALLVAATALSAQTHPNFTGKWKLNAEKSETGSSGITALTVDVDHKDPVFKYTVQGIAGGQQIEETEAFTTDGKESRDSHGLIVKASWDGTALVAVGTSDDGSMVYVSRISLSDDGKTITRVFTQKEDPQARHEIYEKQ